MSEQKEFHHTGLNVIENPDGSFAFEWDPNDKRWSWLNGLTDEDIKVIIEDAIELKLNLEAAADDYQSRVGF